MRVFVIACATSAILLMACPSAFSQDCIPQQPVPSGLTQRPAEVFGPEYLAASGSITLQGNRAKEKFAPVMYSTFGGGVGNFETMLFVNNTSSTGILEVVVDIFDFAGVNVDTSSPIQIAPNGNYRRPLYALEQSGANFGMVRVRVTADSEVPTLLGTTVYSANQFGNPFISDLDVIGPFEPMASVQPLQQLQRLQARTFLGPVPINKMADKDVLNGIFSLVNIVNPSQATINLTAVLVSDNGPTQIIPIPPIPANGGTQFFGAWLRAINNYLTNQPDENVTIALVEQNGIPFVAELLLFDLLSDEDVLGGGGGGMLAKAGGDSVGTLPDKASVFSASRHLAASDIVGTLPFNDRAFSGDPTVGTLPDKHPSFSVNSSTNWTPDRNHARRKTDIDPTMVGIDPNLAGGRARMTSIMPGYTPHRFLISPELTDFQDSGHGTVVSISSISTTPANTVTARYYNQDGVLLGQDFIGSLGLAETAHIGFGCPATPNFPTGVFRGFIRVSCCSGGLIGYSNRYNEGEHTNRKMWGELLNGNGGKEHSRGWFEFGRRTQLVPLVFECDPKVAESNWTVFMTDNVSNIGAWDLDIHSDQGTLDGQFLSLGLQAYNTAGSYFDSIIFNPQSQPHSGLVRHGNGAVRGINVIGGQLQPKVRFGKGPGVYPGPGDTVPW